MDHTITMDQIRERIHTHIHDGYTGKASFESADIIFVEDLDGWILLKADRTFDGPENDTREWLDEIDNQELINFYQEYLEDDYASDDDEEEMVEEAAE
jgi:hypothetical protein